MKVVVCGSRSWDDYETIFERLSLLPDGSQVIHGDCRGADRLAGQAAQTLGLPVTAIRAEWERLGRSAGAIRNQKMLDLRPDLLLAFWDGSSPGTGGMIEQALQRGVVVDIQVQKP